MNVETMSNLQALVNSGHVIPAAVIGPCVQCGSPIDGGYIKTDAGQPVCWHCREK